MIEISLEGEKIGRFADMNQDIDPELDSSEYTQEEKLLVQGVSRFVDELHKMPGVYGVLFRLIEQPPAPDHLEAVIIAPSRIGVEQSGEIVRRSSVLGAEFEESLPEGMGLGFSMLVVPEQDDELKRRYAGKEYFGEETKLSSAFIFTNS